MRMVAVPLVHPVTLVRVGMSEPSGKLELLACCCAMADDVIRRRRPRRGRRKFAHFAWMCRFMWQPFSIRSILATVAMAAFCAAVVIPSIRFEKRTSILPRRQTEPPRLLSTLQLGMQDSAEDAIRPVGEWEPAASTQITTPWELVPTRSAQPRACSTHANN